MDYAHLRYWCKTTNFHICLHIFVAELQSPRRIGDSWGQFNFGIFFTSLRSEGSVGLGLEMPRLTKRLFCRRDNFQGLERHIFAKCSAASWLLVHQTWNIDPSFINACYSTDIAVSSEIAEDGVDWTRVWHLYWFWYDWMSEYILVSDKCYEQIYKYVHMKNTNMMRLNICGENKTNIRIFITLWQSMILIRTNIQICSYQKYNMHMIKMNIFTTNM